MYEVTTIGKTIATNLDLATAEQIAREAATRFSYVEIKHVLTVSPWYAESVRIYR